MQHHHKQGFVVLEKAEGWVSAIAVAVGLVVSLAMVIGLATAGGHVTW